MPKISRETLDKKYGGSMEAFLEVQRMNASKGGKKSGPELRRPKGFDANRKLAAEAAKKSHIARRKR